MAPRFFVAGDRSEIQTQRQIYPLLRHVIVLAPVVAGAQRQVRRQFLGQADTCPVQAALWLIAFQIEIHSRHAVHGNGQILLIGVELTFVRDLAKYLSLRGDLELALQSLRPDVSNDGSDRRS
jgi:hypothetical protein